MDPNLLRGIRYLHSSTSESYSQLRNLLEESLKSKYGSAIDLGPYLPVQDLPSISAGGPLQEDTKNTSSSDNELELDLLKEDLLCIICKGMGVGARNRLLECSDCHNLYHQECHDPKVSDDEIEGSVPWNCAACKYHLRMFQKK